MAFINELIPEADKARIDWSKYKDLTLGKNFEPSRWTVDKEREIYLLRLIRRGPAGAWPEMFVLNWGNTLIVFEVDGESKGDFTSGIDMFWKVLRFHIPDVLQVERDKIIKTFEEAMEQFGCNYNCDKVRSVRFEFA